MLITDEREHAEAGSDRLGELYTRHAPAAGRLAYLLTGDRALAEDLVHDAFLRAFGRFRDLRDPGAFGGYLRQTVVNLARSHARRQRTARTWLERQSGTDEVPPVDVSDRDELWTALLRLPPNQRAAIVLRFYEDLSEADIAGILRCPVGTVKSWIHRGLAKLRDEVVDDA